MISGIQSSAVWNSLSKSISEAIEAVQDTIVTIHGGGRSTSSGVVWRPGVVVTVRNGLRRGEVIKVTRGDEPFNASVAGTDAGTDLAVLRVESNSLKPAETSDLESTRVGELVLVRRPFCAGRHLGQLRNHRASGQPLANLARGTD